MSWGSWGILACVLHHEISNSEEGKGIFQRTLKSLAFSLYKENSVWLNWNLT